MHQNILQLFTLIMLKKPEAPHPERLFLVYRPLVHQRTLRKIQSYQLLKRIYGLVLFVYYLEERYSFLNKIY